MTIIKIVSQQNGNVEKSIFSDGSRVLDFEGEIKLKQPLNIDIRVSTECSFGYNSKTKTTFCDFCHESATTDGVDCDYQKLMSKLTPLDSGLELAIGCNRYTEELNNFLIWCKSRGFICSLTINQGHLLRDSKKLRQAIDKQNFYGLGVSYRSDFKNVIPEFIKNYKHTVFHVISGIDSIEQILELSKNDVKKILILGEKDFGFNQGNVNLKSERHREWFYGIVDLFKAFDLVSFDNLALEQLKIKRFLNKNNWNKFYNYEHSMYIDAAQNRFSSNSRSNDYINWDDMSVMQYFSEVNKLRINQ